MRGGTTKAGLSVLGLGSEAPVLVSVAGQEKPPLFSSLLVLGLRSGPHVALGAHCAISVGPDSPVHFPGPDSCHLRPVTCHPPPALLLSFAFLPMTQAHHNRWSVILAFALVYLFWGSTY